MLVMQPKDCAATGLCVQRAVGKRTRAIIARDRFGCENRGRRVGLAGIKD